MRKFSSYGPVDTDLYYYAPRKELLDQTLTQLVGENPDKNGHYITVWGSRQTGKTWVMQQVLSKLRHNPPHQRFDVVVITLEHLKMENDVDVIVQSIAREIIKELGLKHASIHTLKEFYNIFAGEVLKKPLILILDEFDALAQEAISGIVGVFRNIHIRRQYQADKPTAEKDYLLHGLALIGVRAVLGVQNVTGSPFNVQRSLHIPNLTFEEVAEMFKWYERESGQTVEQEVIERLFYETQGQPGLTCWLGELLTETYNQKTEKPITMANFEEVYADAIDALPNNNILNILSKARQEPHKQFVLEMFKTDDKIRFRYDDARINFLYMNGVIQREKVGKTENYVKFASPFVQKRLFNYFANELFAEVGRLYQPFENLEDTITENALNIKNLMRRYERYLKENREWLLKDAPRRADLRIYEAVYHFNLYMYLQAFLRSYGGQVYPEFPTGNGQIDLLIQHANQMYGLEVKSYTNLGAYKKALKQATQYGRRLQLAQVSLVFFVEYVDDENRQKYEVAYKDEETGVTVNPIFVETGN